MRASHPTRSAVWMSTRPRPCWCIWPTAPHRCAAGAVLDALADLVAATSIADVRAELEGRPQASRVRLAYLLSGVAPELVEQLEVVPGHKVWFGPRGPLRHHDATWNVADTVLPIRPTDLAGERQ